LIDGRSSRLSAAQATSAPGCFPQGPTEKLGAEIVFHENVLARVFFMSYDYFSRNWPERIANFGETDGFS
jgi:hypothetical protein